ncbi:laccase-7-like [Gastrolobium bilobum]|uniref:laccase-7-like n=1 Tax=Gastrolobium bilobum TaxID=150636 RepID=UPI002AB20E59|nr:laccase-7-like [Gastrolobium bilobum]
MKFLLFSLAWTFGLLACCFTSASTVEYTFNVQNMNIQRLCNEHVIVAVNRSLPGPTIEVREGDAVIVHVFNQSPYNITIHWHGLFQRFSAWADGTEYITQCPILPGNSYTYKFNVTGQEGTLWWHAHAFDLQATVYGAFIIRPRLGQSYPFPQPYDEVPIVLGDWFNGNVVDIDIEALHVGHGPNLSNAYTINGLPGDLYNCSQNQTFKINVTQGKTYLLQMVNAAIDNHLFFKLANHTFTVVAVDASYTAPYLTEVIFLAPGQSADVLFTANQVVGSYYMAASPYSIGVPKLDNTTTRGIVVYENATISKPVMPKLPAFNDTLTAFTFCSNITSLVGAPHWVPVPENVDEHMLITVGLGLDGCPKNVSCEGPNKNKFSASMNNQSFVFPKARGYSTLEAFFYNLSGVYTANFPDYPPNLFDFTNYSLLIDYKVMFARKSTMTKKLKFNSTVEIVFQDTALIHVINHPMHIHGYSFHVLAQGFGNFNYATDKTKYNLINPQFRNTIAVPAGGWAVIRFQANNPGIWFVHCHVDEHMEWGLDMALEVENGPTPSTSVPPPPPDLPKCNRIGIVHKSMFETNNATSFL